MNNINDIELDQPECEERNMVEDTEYKIVILENAIDTVSQARHEVVAQFKSADLDVKKVYDNIEDALETLRYQMIDLQGGVKL